MANKFYTILIVPDKTAQTRRIILPGWILKASAIGFSFIAVVSVIMVIDYWYVMNQIGENKDLRMENRRLKQQVQVFKNKLTTIESTMDRIKTFATRLKVITNIEDRSNLIQSLNENPPDASTTAGNDHPAGPKTGVTGDKGAGSTASTANSASAANANQSTFVASAAAAPNTSSPGEDNALRHEYEQLDEYFSHLNHETLYVEQMIQDQYELLADQKSFLAALPTIRPAIGYGTSGFGIRRSPFGGRVKMHEGLDIANHPGTPIHAPADGTVFFASTKTGYGQMVILDHGYGIQTWYGHAKKVLVSKGQQIRRGEAIALMGSSGRATGPHVHYEVRVNGMPVDPRPYILVDME